MDSFLINVNNSPTRRSENLRLGTKEARFRICQQRSKCVCSNIFLCFSTPRYQLIGASRFQRAHLEDKKLITKSRSEKRCFCKTFIKSWAGVYRGHLICHIPSEYGEGL
ncbi:hypothetical protein JTE90_014017 [Oedothorax gibbosus]|uniref:Uncharacterized protein n=1 Tax=Oedothorax gibbosus TaxID=931172 RepID=A0AAV6U4K5_9ARAC|nr:hypothetical protein JTE90_014017 [Oedothorax gibbosus]